MKVNGVETNPGVYFRELLNEKPLMQLTEADCEFMLQYAEMHKPTRHMIIYYLRNSYYIANERLVDVLTGPDTNLKKLLHYFNKHSDDIVLIAKFMKKMRIDSLLYYEKFNNQ